MLLERRSTGTIEIYFLFRREGKQERKKLGAFEDLGTDGKRRGLAFWRKEAERVSAEVRQFQSLAQYETTQRQRAVDEERLRAAHARQGTFGQLLDDYVANMVRLGKKSSKAVQGALQLDVVRPFPELASRKAKDIEPADISAILRHCLTRPVASKGRGQRLTKANATNGKRRQADKLRAYLKAAFSFGLKHDLNPQRAGDAVLYGLKTNPALDVPVIEGANRANTWALSKDELKAVVLAIEGLPERRRAIAKTMLYLAGQRVEMLCRVTWADLYSDGVHGPVIRLLDIKGGHDTPEREHLLPMTERVSRIMAPLLALQREGRAPGPFSLRGSVTIAPSTALDIFTEIGTQLAETGLVGQRFTWRHMRATIETHLAALGVSQERRAWLLSHGRSGVQAKHYDRYNYLPEKRFDLERWADYLDAMRGSEDSASSNVLQFG